MRVFYLKPNKQDFLMIDFSSVRFFHEYNTRFVVCNYAESVLIISLQKYGNYGAMVIRCSSIEEALNTINMYRSVETTQELIENFDYSIQVEEFKKFLEDCGEGEMSGISMARFFRVKYVYDTTKIVAYVEYQGVPRMIFVSGSECNLRTYTEHRLNISNVVRYNDFDAEKYLLENWLGLRFSVKEITQDLIENFEYENEVRLILRFLEKS